MVYPQTPLNAANTYGTGKRNDQTIFCNVKMDRSKANKISFERDQEMQSFMEKVNRK